MNAEALIGTVLGTCTLQKLVGQGGMGAVFLAQQSRPRRQVAVKVLLPMTPLSPNQLAAFLERFRRETDAAASLEHPNIVPVYEYGERDGLAYLVMPYISGGTLRDDMEREGPLPLAKVVNYLDQMAAALDLAHGKGVIHRDIKPANILMTPEGRLLLTDFGLVKIVIEGQEPLTRLTGAGAPVGTPDYMAPEQVIGEGVDARADLYSLGVILYQMVTGTTPFQGETPMQIAAQHLQIPPPSPQMLRPDLPITTEQVMLRALAKRPGDRYMHAQDLANAFRASLDNTSVLLGMTGPQVVPSLSGNTSPRLFAPKPLLDQPGRPGTGALPSVGSGLLNKPTGMLPAVNGSGGLLSKPTGTMPAAGGGLLSRTGMFPSVSSSTSSLPAAGAGGGLLSKTGKFPQMSGGTGLLAAYGNKTALDTPTAGFPTPASTSSVAPSSASMQSFSTAGATTTGSLMVAGQQTAANTVKLTGPMKIVQMPVAGQPGRYVTGLLPVLPQTQESNTSPISTPKKKGLKSWVKVTATLLAVLVLVLGTVGTLWFMRTHSGRTTTSNTVASTPATGKTGTGQPDPRATAAAQATATYQANVILSDSLSTNIHNWPTSPTDVYVFKDGAYHITDHGDNGRATVLQTPPFTGPLGYTLTMDEVKGDDNSANNSFGMILRFNQQTKGNKTTTTFYSFEVVNTKGGEYQFWKYDDSQLTNANQSPWTEIWHQPFGNEFHVGHGPQSVNTCKVYMNGGKFAIAVNGKLITNAIQDTALTNGTVGMIVNLNGTEIAFTNLLLTHN